ncbi:monooxygenase [Polyplosphaeria fusca]|uniref:Monooxygenase n=1 Tax=Polyplosphaeria fusca TaxID=682080 RepID=A0A9P4QMA2_9PLEO|nr:monooxygenase [Polyplosphaeria fusca]
MSSLPKIALIGAGPASLTLANILQRHSIPLTIYESSPTPRNQGGTLDLHPAAGQLALREAGLWDAFTQHARPEADVLKLCHIDGTILWDENAADKQPQKQLEHGRPEIDREALMRILVDGLREGTIRYGKKLLRVSPTSPTATTTHALHFADGTIESDFDLIVGGDGAWSKVRALLAPGTAPSYSGISSLECWINDVAARPAVRDFVGEGSVFAFGEGRAVQAQRQGGGSLRTYANLRVPEDFWETCGIDVERGGDGARRDFVDRYLDGVGQELRSVVLESGDAMIPRKLYELPVGWRWDGRPGVTLIGDAAHVMTPFAGVGVNVGMADGLVLARGIVAVSKGEKELGEAVREYEEEMFPRAEKNARKTAHGKEHHFTDTGAREFADRLRAHYGGEKKSAPGV